MPYGPVLRNTSIDALLEDAEITRETMKFMNIAFDGKQEFLDNYPTAFHVDLKQLARKLFMKRIINSYSIYLKNMKIKLV